MRELSDVLIVSKKRNILRTVKVPKGTFHTVVFLGGGIVVLTLLLMILNARFMFANLDMTRSIHEHEMLIRKLDSLQLLIDNVQQHFDLQIEDDNRQRTFWQMAHIHPDIWSMGVGGIKPLPKNGALSKKTRTQLETLMESMDVLQGKCFLRNESLQDIEQKASSKYELWSHIPSINPVPGYAVGSGFGYRRDPINKKIIKMHWGVDIGAPRGTNIYASADGVISNTGWNSGYGLCVDIDHGYGFRSRYAHCNSILVKKGDVVQRGQIIATVGSTGRTVAPHLHYEVHVSGVKVNPAPYIDQTEIVFD